jgi:hypothetical protein
MDTDRLNRWLSLGANIGVVVGIALLILEINQNTEMMSAQMAQARSENLLGRYQNEIHSDHWAEILAKRRSAQSMDEWINSLTPVEYERVWTYQLFQWHFLQSQYSQYRAGFLDERIWNGPTKADAARFMRTWPYFNFSYESADPEFRQYMDQVATELKLPKLLEGQRMGKGKGMSALSSSENE